MNSLDQILQTYHSAALALGAAGLLLSIQLLVADLAGILGRHAPGTPVAPDPRRFLFRASRAHANTNESLAAFVALVLAAILLGAAEDWLAGLAWLWIAARVGHMLCYYAGLVLARSIVFAVSLLALFGLAALVVASWI